MQKWLVNHCMCTYIHLSSKRLLLAVYVGHRGDVALVSAWFCLGQVKQPLAIPFFDGLFLLGNYTVIF